MAIAASYIIYHGPVDPLFSTMAATEARGPSHSTICWDKCRDHAFSLLCMLRMLPPIVFSSSEEVFVRVKSVPGNVSL